MNLLFTGTGSGKTSLKRYHSSLVISVHDFSLLVDAGDSVSRALLSEGIRYNSIDGVVITHLHPDHFSGFTSLIVQMKMGGRTEPLSIYIHHTLVNILKNFLSSSYVFLERLGFPVNITGFDFDTEIWVSDELVFIARRNTHLDEYEKHDPTISIASCSLLFSSSDNNVFYSGDLGSENDLYIFKDHAADLYITEAAHVSIEGILEMIKKINPGKVILTHIADEDLPWIRKKIVELEENRIIIAEDGMNLSVNRYSG